MCAMTRSAFPKTWCCKKPPTAKPSSQPSNVVNLFDALKKSLAEEGGGKEGGGKSSAGKRGKSSTRSDKKRTSA